jgi:hypothetical protein
MYQIATKPGEHFAAGAEFALVGMALKYSVHQFDQVIRGYGLAAFEYWVHWGSFHFLSELICPRWLKAIGAVGHIG